MSRILVVEDEQHLAEGLRFNLEAEGHDATVAGDGEQALTLVLADHEHFDALVLDVMLPGKSGFTVASELRAAGKYMPILMLTARGRAEDVLKGFEAGADDYLAKPFSPKELVLRVAAILRRLAAPAVASGGRLAAGPVALDRGAHRATVSGKEVELTATEFRLLDKLIERRDRVLSRTQLLESVWHAQPDIQTRTVDMHVQRLRAKLGDAGDWVETVRGVGYRFREPAPPPTTRRGRG